MSPPPLPARVPSRPLAWIGPILLAVVLAVAASQLLGDGSGYQRVLRALGLLVLGGLASLVAAIVCTIFGAAGTQRYANVAAMAISAASVVLGVLAIFLLSFGGEGPCCAAPDYATLPREVGIVDAGTCGGHDVSIQVVSSGGERQVRVTNRHAQQSVWPALVEGNKSWGNRSSSFPHKDGWLAPGQSVTSTTIPAGTDSVDVIYVLRTDGYRRLACPGLLA